MARKKFKISYIRKPFAKRSLVSLPLALLSLALCVVSLALSVRLKGEGGLDVAAWGVSSLLFAVVGLGYGGLSLFEKEKNYLFAKIGMGITGGLILFWTCMIIVGVMV
ncbi:MAG: calcium:proton exchanger [Lachnospiraceae bacterium]|nr:calcium:proton exchanger [Lachnospiraceae bacterium]MCI9184408.1 calcium:proton exchanger [Lachnospiraceae bacterium]